MKTFICAGLLAVMFVMPGRAWATCYVIQSGEAGPAVLTAPGFNLSFDPNVPDGTVLLTKKLSFLNARSSVVRCQVGLRATFFFPRNGSSNPGVYPTGIPGVGMAMWFTTGGGALAGKWGRVIDYYTATDMKFPEGLHPGGFGGITLQFVKTGPITAGGVISGEVGHMRAEDGHSLPLVSWRIGGGIVVDPQVPTCRVTTPAITVPLGNVPASTFTGVGSVSTGKPVNIVLECSGGNTGTFTNVYTTLTDHTNPGNVSDTLSLATDSTATGLGIQVLNGSTVIKYGPDSSAAGNTNQWKAGEAGNGTFTIPLTARYVQTAPKITPGTANGLATFTMSYQ
ncbi:fimbrial protein [Burkholderia stagnalis]|nr:fimbrial protein [Burkholderia stagnalis]